MAYKVHVLPSRLSLTASLHRAEPEAVHIVVVVTTKQLHVTKVNQVLGSSCL